MMQDEIKATARDVLDKYLSETHSRKTPERFAILDAVYTDGGCFTLEELNARLVGGDFHVSRATLYNTIRLFIQFRLIVRHRFQTGTKYEPSYMSGSHCHMICTVCGKDSETDLPEVATVMESVKLRRFRKECFALYVYGVCASCQNRISKACKKKNKV